MDYHPVEYSQPMECTKEIVECVKDFDGIIQSLKKFKSSKEVDQQNSVFIFDIDDFILRFLDPWVCQGGITEMKKSFKGDEWNELLGVFRLGRKAVLYHKDWPEVIQKLKAEGYQVLFLTKIGTGKCGPIESMERWRVQELLNLFKGTQDHVYECAEGEELFSNLKFELSEELKEKGASYEGGIAFTGDNLSKDDYLECILKNNSHIKNIWAGDDKKENLEKMGTVCKKRAVSFKAAHFEDPSVNTPFNQNIVNARNKMWQEEKTWLDYNEMIEYMNSL